jgi:hypothetical protein
MMIVALAAAVFMQDAPAPEEPRVAQLAVAELVRRIDRKIEAMAAQLRESEPERAARLDRARALLKDPDTFLPGKLDKVLEELGRKNFENAVVAGSDAAGILRAILDVLEGRVDPTPTAAQRLKTYEELKRRIAERRAEEESILRGTRDGGKADELRRRQEKNRELTDELRRDVPRDDSDVADPLRKAAQAMEDAERDLKSGGRDGAEQAEKDAVDQLREAEESVDRRIRDLKREVEQEATLDMRRAVARALEVQRTLNAGTRAVDQARRERGALTRAQQQRLRGELAPAQEGIAEDLGATLPRLGEEDVEVFRIAIKSAIDEMGESAAGLGKADPGPRTQAVQESIVRTLEALVEAFDLKLRASKSTTPPDLPGDGPHAPPPLVPDLVQLHLMRKLQEGILRRTETAGRTFEPDSPALRACVRRLSDEQDELSRSLARFIRRFEERK